MFERILVPLDGSPIAERALPVAARVARASRGVLVLMQVVEQSHEYGGALTQAPRVQEQLLEAALAEASSYLAMLVKSPECEGIEVTTEVLAGAPAEHILAAAEESRADLIVMGSHGRTGFVRWAMGSVTQKVVHHSPVPVLVLREKSIRSFPQAGARYPLSALVALDGSPLAEEALLPAARLVADLGAPGPGALHLTQVVKPPLLASEERTNEVGEGMREQASTYLEIVAARLRKTLEGGNVSITWSVTFERDVAAALLASAEDGGQGEGYWGCDLIALATSGRGYLHRWVMGSVAERVLVASRLPVLIVRPPDLAETLGAPPGESAVKVADL